jgi:UDP-N-acetylglucosamine 2-epimerase
MTEQQIQKYGEIQYLQGRLDELHKALPTIVDLHRKRKLDARLQKYYDKLKELDEISYNLYLVEIYSRKKSKERSIKQIKSLLEEVLQSVTDLDLKDKIVTQIEKY